MRGRAPSPVVITPVDTQVRSQAIVERLEGCDRVVVAGLDLLSPEDVAALVPLRPVVWLMSPPQPWQRPLLEAARPLVVASPEMRGWWPWLPAAEVCSGWFDTSEVPRGVAKEGHALWAARNHPQKGRVEARMWAAARGVELLELTDVPRAAVLEAMGPASYFVLLAKGPDPCPTAVIEAEIAGCEVVTNGLVGRVPVRGADEVAGWIEALPGRFWGWVCD